jgi:hypothetical protein
VAVQQQVAVQQLAVQQVTVGVLIGMHPARRSTVSESAPATRVGYLRLPSLRHPGGGCGGG